MKAKLTFSLPDDEDLFRDAVKGRDYHMALDAIAQAFRSKAKHAEPHTTTWEDARQLFLDTLEKEGVELE